MTLHLHHLRGCAPAPLAHYLKALGVLRIVAQQKDPEARGFWRDEHFCLLTSLDREALQRFFLEEYAPTPAFNPWGARSGFYAGSSETSARKLLVSIERSTGARLASFRHEVSAVRAAIASVGGRKPEDSDEKVALLGQLRRQLRDSSSEWLDTVTSVVGDDFRTPAIIGSGGNEGSGSYLSAYLQSVVDCVLSPASPRASYRRLFRSLFGSVADDPEASIDFDWGGTFGQFLPAGAGSAWDFLLTIEGAIVFRSAVTRRSAGTSAFFSSPFYLPHEAMGSGSNSRIDEYAVNKGRLNRGRGEQWFPLWSKPAAFAEVAQTVSEGRCVVGRRSVTRPLEAAAAVGRLGVARGLDGFVRYGYLQRNNLALHFAVPLGRIDVRARGHIRILEDIEHWLRNLRRAARASKAPGRLVAAEQGVANAAFKAANVDTPASWQSLLHAAARMEALQVSGTGFEAGPLPRLSAGWLDAAADNSPEWRLAVSLGSAAAEYKGGRPFDGVRAHVLSLAKGRYATTAEKRLVNDPRVVFTGRDSLGDLVALVERRVVEATQRGQRVLPLCSRFGRGAQLADLSAFLGGAIDVERTLWLARALMAVEWETVTARASRPTCRAIDLDEGWMALRLCGTPFPVGERRAPIDLAMVRRLTSGDASGAVSSALQRLRALGYRPPLLSATTDASTAQRWAAALAFPIDRAVAVAMASRFQNHAERLHHQTEPS